MKINKCRVCHRKFFEKPQIEYKNAPKAAQFLPNIKLSKSDQGVDLKIYQCSGCGLVQLGNNPVPYYKQVIRSVKISSEMSRFRLKQFNDFIKRYTLKKKKVVEIGCGGGEYLSLMKQTGAKAYGIEYSKNSVDHCQKNGLKVSPGFIDREYFQLDGAPFDAFFMINFLEHLPDPNSTLTGIYNNLSDDAVGLVEVPNFDMILRKNLFFEFITDHLLYFTHETLKTILTLNGFEILNTKMIWYDYIISAQVKKRKKLNFLNLINQQTKIYKEINRYLTHFKNKQVAIWGAGHQALTIMALAKLGNKIKYVVDSAPFKQDKFTPVSNIPIVAPSKLNSDPPEAIIIIGGGYSDEIKKIIRKKFNPGLPVAILRDFGLERV